MCQMVHAHELTVCWARVRPYRARHCCSAATACTRPTPSAPTAAAAAAAALLLLLLLLQVLCALALLEDESVLVHLGLWLGLRRRRLAVRTTLPLPARPRRRWCSCFLVLGELATSPDAVPQALGGRCVAARGSTWCRRDERRRGRRRQWLPHGSLAKIAIVLLGQRRPVELGLGNDGGVDGLLDRRSSCSICLARRRSRIAENYTSSCLLSFAALLRLSRHGRWLATFWLGAGLIQDLAACMNETATRGTTPCRAARSPWRVHRALSALLAQHGHRHRHWQWVAR